MKHVGLAQNLEYTLVATFTKSKRRSPWHYIGRCIGWAMRLRAYGGIRKRYWRIFTQCDKFEGQVLCVLTVDAISLCKHALDKFQIFKKIICVVAIHQVRIVGNL